MTGLLGREQPAARRYNRWAMPAPYFGLADGAGARPCGFSESSPPTQLRATTGQAPGSWWSSTDDPYLAKMSPIILNEYRHSILGNGERTDCAALY